MTTISPKFAAAKRFTLLGLAVCLLINCGCNGVAGQVFNSKKIKGSGVLDSEIRDLKDFEELFVSSVIHANVIVGDDFSVTVTAEDNILPLVESGVSNKRLRLRLAPNMSINTKKQITVDIVMPKLTAIECSGASHFSAVGLANKKLSIDANGASKLDLVGDVENLNIDASGAAKIDASSTDAESVKLDASGAAQVKIYSTKSVRGDASGAAKVTVSGSPSEIKIDRSGAAKIKIDSNDSAE